jgi:hypothetical protein
MKLSIYWNFSTVPTKEEIIEAIIEGNSTIVELSDIPNQD